MPRQTRTPSPWLALLASAGLLTAMSLVGLGPQGTVSADDVKPAVESPVPDDSMGRVLSALEAEVALAEGKRYYLVLDADPRRLRLMHRGVLLHEMEVHSVEVGTPRLLFVPRSDPAPVYDRAWLDGQLVPPRIRTRTEIDTSPDSTDDVPIPPLPEELYPTPDRFFVRYPGGLALEIRPDSLASTSGWKQRFADVLPSLRKDDAWRVRLQMDDDEVGRLYRSFPDSCAFLFVSTPWREGERANDAKERAAR